MKPICVNCKLFFTAKKTGVSFEEGMPVNQDKSKWESYKLWKGDLWECRCCGTQIIAGVASQPLSEHYQENYGEMILRFPPVLRVDDC